MLGWTDRGGKLFIRVIRVPFFLAYYANGQQIASRMDGELYYSLTDPSGQATVFASEDGTETGYVLYDPLGTIIKEDMSPALKEALLSHIDTSTGLHYDGQRWYDPRYRLYLQPGLVEGPPVAPQALNPYSANSRGRPGIAEIVAPEANLLTDIVSNAASNIPGAVTGSLARVLVHPTLKGNETALLAVLRNPEHRKLLDEEIILGIQGLKGVTLKQLGGLKSGHIFSFSGSPRLLRPEEADQLVLTNFGRATLELSRDYPGFRGRISKYSLRIGIGIDVGVAALLEWNAPYGTNPYLSNTQKGMQFLTNLSAAGFASAATYYTVTALGITNPVGLFVTTVGVATIYGLRFGELANAINEGVFNRENREFELLGDP